MLTTASGGLSGQLQKIFDKRALIAIRQELVHDQLVYLADLPKKEGGTQVRFMRPDSADRTKVLNVSAEGVEQATERGMSYTFIDTTLIQLYIQDSISDVLSDFELFNTTKNWLDVAGADFGHRIDFDIVTEYVTQAAVGARIYGGGFATFAALVADTGANTVLSFVDLDRAFTMLTVARTPKARVKGKGGVGVGGMSARSSTYVASVPTQVAFTIRLDANNFIAAAVRGQNDGLFNAEIGTWYGLRLLEHTQSFIEKNVENTYDNTGISGTGNTAKIYSTICTGYQAVACVEVAGGSPFSPKTIVVDRPDSGNRLGLRKYVGLKAYESIKTLKNDWSVTIRNKSTF
jgi:N4-gp56 family major capsid protein